MCFCMSFLWPYDDIIGGAGRTFFSLVDLSQNCSASSDFLAWEETGWVGNGAAVLLDKKRRCTDHWEMVVGNRRGRRIKAAGICKRKVTQQVAGHRNRREKVKGTQSLNVLLFPRVCSNVLSSELQHSHTVLGIFTNLFLLFRAPKHCTMHKATDHQIKDSGSLEWAV